jgi:hypothetical protein
VPRQVGMMELNQVLARLHVAALTPEDVAALRAA